MDINQKIKPLADRMRPESLDYFFGQEEIIGKGKLLRQAIVSDSLPSMIFWGPPGSGKTTLAFIIAKQTKSVFKQISAVSSGLKDLRNILEEAKENEKACKRTILFIDEIHRWNKKQQDGLLPYVEHGLITLIGATTENPSFEVVGALLSRCRVFVLSQLDKKSISEIIKKATEDKEKGLGDLKIKIEEKVINTLAQMSNGDARRALSILEYAAHASKEKSQGKKRINITQGIVKEAFQKSHLFYDKDGEEHYNIISALHKSMRGGDLDASLYWMARMLEAGEDPLYVARRIVRFACEDIGLANPQALGQAVAAYQACHFIGMPECNVILAQAVAYMARSKKSNFLYKAYGMAANDVREHGNLPVPLHIRNGSTKLMKEIGYGDGYKYSPDHDYKEEQDYMPDKLKGKKYSRE